MKAFELARHLSRQWLVAYSGGKDSTVVLDLAYRFKDGVRLVVVHNEELLKAPPLFSWVYTVLDGIARAGVEVYIVVPKEDFISVIFERQYSPPGPAFTWCTARLKERPTAHLMSMLKGKWVKLTGVRMEESLNRQRLVLKRCGLGTDTCGATLWLQKKSRESIDIAPIVDWSTAQVVAYLRTHKRPWDGSDYSYLLDVVYCGEERIRNGCTLCTLVHRDPMLLRYAECFKDPRYGKVAELKEKLREIGMDWDMRQYKSKKLNEKGLETVREFLVEIFDIMPELLSGYATFKPHIIERYLPEVAHHLPRLKVPLTSNITPVEL